jgi:hypothetical protein
MQKTKVTWWEAILASVFAFFKVRCGKPRLPPGTASMAPQVVRERLEHLYCEKFKHHVGPCEAQRPHNRDPREEDESEVWE